MPDEVRDSSFRWNLLVPILVALSFVPISASAGSFRTSSPALRDSTDRPAEPVRELVLWFRYAGLVDTYVSARTDGERIYLPLAEIFSLLRLYARIDAAAAEGYFASEARPYRILFEAQTAEVDGHVYTFGHTDFILSEAEVFLTPDLLDAWFGLSFTTNLSELVLAMRADVELPIERLRRRAASRPILHDPYAVLKHAPLTYGRMRRNLGGGALDYGLSVSQDLRGTNMNLDAAMGAEVMGGDLQWRASGGYAGTTYFNQNHFLWRYVLEDERLAQIRVGDVYSTGLENVAYRGVHLTNTPAAPKTYFAEHQVAGDAPPDWDIELFLDERLVGISRSDASGRYHFTVPLLYGTSMVRIKMYGPAGEEREELQRLQIPFNMLASGEMRYNVHAGQTRNSGRWMTQADVGYGINDRVTATAGLDVHPRYQSMLEGSREMTRAVVPYLRLTSRFATHYLAEADLSTGGYRQVSVQGFLPSHAALDARYVRFANSSAFIVDDRRSMIQAGGYLPFYVREHPMSVRIQAGRTAFGRFAQYSFGSSFFAGLRNVRVQLASRGDWSAAYGRFRLSPNVSYTYSGAFARGLMITAGADYEMIPGRIERLRLEIAHNLRPWTRLRVTFDAGFHGAPTALGFRLSVDLPYARTSTSADFRNHGQTISQSIRGSVAFDEQNRHFYFDRLPVVGRSSAAVRLFVDGDGDGLYDANERVIDEDVVRVRSGSAGSKRHDGDVRRISGLLPYVQYTAAVEEALLSDPMLVPSQSAFSFIADPNAVKRIDIPLYNAGVIEGRVMEKREGVLHPVGGATVRLVRRGDGAERILRTFSDGTYYEMGLPPGTYDVLLDGEIPARTFTIEPAGEPSIVEGLDLVLPGTTIYMSESEGPTRIGRLSGGN